MDASKAGAGGSPPKRAATDGARPKRAAASASPPKRAAAGAADRSRHDGAAPGKQSGAQSRKYRLDHGQPIGAEVARMARGRIEHALDELSGASGSSPEEAVHEARKDMKKLRALLRLVRPQLGEPLYARENARFRDAARRLSDVRDADVMLAALGSLEGVERGAARRLRAALRAHRARLEAESGGGVDASRQQVAAELAEAREAVAGWPLEGEGFAAIEPGLRRVYAQGRNRYRAALRDPSPERLHDWRKRVKDHWYHLTILRDLWPAPMEALAHEAHVLSERLGDDHDLVVLRDWAHERAGELRLDSPESLDEAVARRRAKLLADAIAIGRRLYGEKAAVVTRRTGRWFEAWMAGAPTPVP
ncbi:MAG: CHAD domain-containing protein [Nocardioidaceae bacterium]